VEVIVTGGAHAQLDIELRAITAGA
jgi:hypothetical protein